MVLNNNNKIRLGVILAVVILYAILLSSNLIALGITPGRTTIDYEKGKVQEVTFSVLNKDHKNMQVLLTVQGELNRSVTLYNSTVEFLPSEESKQFKYTVELPDDISNEPGPHLAEVMAIEIPKASNEGTFVGATVAVISEVYVNVPCPGKCIDADLNVLDAQNGETATLIVPVVNRGKVGIGDVRAVIDIYTSLNEKVATVETDYYPLDAGKRTELSGKWDVDVNSGNYLAKVTLFYDGETKEFEKEFAIGDQLLSIESILVNNFQLGEIAKLQILVENQWSEEIQGVFANLLVYNEDSQTMADIKSSSENIPALSKKELIAYWDTVGVEEGEYDGKLMVKYGKKSADKNLVLKVSEDSLEIFGVGYAIRPSGGKGVNITSILLILVIILLIVNLAWFVFFRRISGMLAKRKKK